MLHWWIGYSKYISGEGEFPSFKGGWPAERLGSPEDRPGCQICRGVKNSSRAARCSSSSLQSLRELQEPLGEPSIYICFLGLGLENRSKVLRPSPVGLEWANGEMNHTGRLSEPRVRALARHSAVQADAYHRTQRS